ncbi:conjugal transfer protein TraT [Helicobacter apodemus]|uniref:Conjugal transfer protein TraT n=2 Tax=Helicobacter TaxID=209 RepID=A0A4U8UGP0_9HELI|nr:complement resistance protein TraT [Helicobacter apodemus]TLE16578.1 conjugal transfer protein TraT [Helicobacter apodemus]
MIRIILGLVALVLLSGCLTTQTQSKVTMSQSVFIDPVSKDKKNIFVSTHNTSGQKVDLENKIIKELLAKGYSISDDPQKATYILQVNVLYVDVKKENNAAPAGAVGGVAGAGVGAYNHGSATGTVVGGLLGAAVGALAGKLMEDTIIQMQVDINIQQKIEGGTTRINATANQQAEVKDGRRHGFFNSFAGDVAPTQGGGKLNDDQINYDKQVFKSDFSQKRTSMLAEATKLNLKFDEVVQVLEDKIATQIVGIF